MCVCIEQCVQNSLKQLQDEVGGAAEAEAASASSAVEAVDGLQGLNISGVADFSLADQEEDGDAGFQRAGMDKQVIKVLDDDMRSGLTYTPNADSLGKFGDIFREVKDGEAGGGGGGGKEGVVGVSDKEEAAKQDFMRRVSDRLPELELSMRQMELMMQRIDSFLGRRRAPVRA